MMIRKKIVSTYNYIYALQSSENLVKHLLCITIKLKFVQNLKYHIYANIFLLEFILLTVSIS